MDNDLRLAIEEVILLADGDEAFKRTTKKFDSWFHLMVNHLADLDKKPVPNTLKKPKPPVLQTVKPVKSIGTGKGVEGNKFAAK